MPEGTQAASRRLPFTFQAVGGIGRLALTDLSVGPLVVDRLELEVSDLGTDPGVTPAERFQRRRTRLRSLAIRMTAQALDERVAAVKKQLGGLGITQLAARPADGFISVRARATDGLAAADISFRIQLVSSGAQLRALASTVRVHGHLPTPGPVIADRIMAGLLGSTDARGVVERPHARGLCDVEADLVGALLWHLMPPSGWRLPAVADIELVQIRSTRGLVEIAYGPAGTRGGDLGVRPSTHALAAAHDLMHSVDQQLREGHLEDAMRGYRALLAAGGPDQPLLLERILALAGARPAWFFDGLELARQALGRWPHFPPAHAALASITLAQGDAREAASHLMQIAQLASAEGDDDQAALAALAGARLLRVLEPRSATQLYQLALEHDASSSEAADSLADRLADEQRWPELVRLVRARAVTAEPARAVQLRLRLADVFVHQLDDTDSAQQELVAARALAPDDPAVHEMTATILASSDPGAAVEAWREVARLAEARGDHRTCGRAWAILGGLLAEAAAKQRTHDDGVGDASPSGRPGPAEPGTAEHAWQRALELDPLQTDAIVGLAQAAAARGEHAVAAELYERLRGLGLAQVIAAKHELALARSLVVLERTDDARASLRRATLAGGETAAEAHAVLAEIAEATFDREHAAAELDTAIASLVDLAGSADVGRAASPPGTDDDEPTDDERLMKRAAELAITRAGLLDRTGQTAAATADYQRAHELAQQHAPELARDAARTMLSRSLDARTERRWIDAVLATRPPPMERAALLVRRADVRRREKVPDLAAALADLHEALRLTDESSASPGTEPEDREASFVDTRRRAYQLEADLLAHSGDQRARAQALASLARIAERADRVEVETAAAAAWLAADEPAAALPHGARAHATIEEGVDIPAALRREVLVTLGEAAWRQRAWPDVIRAYRGLIEDPGAEAPRVGTFRYRLAVAADRSADATLALDTLRPLVLDVEAARSVSTELRGQALRLYADLAERAGDLGSAAIALETFASLSVDSSTTARADAMYRAGELFRRADRADDAIRCLEAALRISDTHLPALDALETAWRERGDLERVSVILGRKVAATARHPARQKPLLSRLGDLQAQLQRPDVALATHQRALEIDPAWRPSLRYVSLRLRDSGQVVAAAGGLAQLAGDLSGDAGVDLAVVARERQLAAAALAELVLAAQPPQLDAIREVARPALERSALDGTGTGAVGDIAAALARLRGEALPSAGASNDREEDTQSGRTSGQAQGALSLREAARRSRAAGKLTDALATLEAANHVSPGDHEVLRELVELANEVLDHEAAVRHLASLADVLSGARRGEVLHELADLLYDKLDDAMRAREVMRAAAESFTGARRDATLRMLATEAATNLAWDVAAEALAALPIARWTTADVVNLASALQRAGRDADAIAAVERATTASRFDDGGVLLARLQHEADRKSTLARALEQRARTARNLEAEAMRAEARELREAIGEFEDVERRWTPPRNDRRGPSNEPTEADVRGPVPTGPDSSPVIQIIDEGSPPAGSPAAGGSRRPLAYTTGVVGRDFDDYRDDDEIEAVSRARAAGAARTAAGARPGEAEPATHAKTDVDARTPVEAAARLEAEPATHAKTDVDARTPIEAAGARLEAEPATHARTDVDARTPVEAAARLEAEPATHAKTDVDARAPVEAAGARLEAEPATHAKTDVDARAPVEPAGARPEAEPAAHAKADADARAPVEAARGVAGPTVEAEGADHAAGADDDAELQARDTSSEPPRDGQAAVFDAVAARAARRAEDIGAELDPPAHDAASDRPAPGASSGGRNFAPPAGGRAEPASLGSTESPGFEELRTETFHDNQVTVPRADLAGNVAPHRLDLAATFVGTIDDDRPAPRPIAAATERSGPHVAVRLPAPDDEPSWRSGPEAATFVPEMDDVAAGDATPATTTHPDRAVAARQTSGEAAEETGAATTHVPDLDDLAAGDAEDPATRAAIAAGDAARDAFTMAREAMRAEDAVPAEDRIADIERDASRLTREIAAERWADDGGAAPDDDDDLAIPQEVAGPTSARTTTQRGTGEGKQPASSDEPPPPPRVRPPTQPPEQPIARIKLVRQTRTSDPPPPPGEAPRRSPSQPPATRRPPTQPPPSADEAARRAPSQPLPSRPATEPPLHSHRPPTPPYGTVKRPTTEIPVISAETSAGVRRSSTEIPIIREPLGETRMPDRDEAITRLEEERVRSNLARRVATAPIGAPDEHGLRRPAPIGAPDEHGLRRPARPAGGDEIRHETSGAFGAPPAMHDDEGAARRAVVAAVAAESSSGKTAIADDATLTRLEEERARTRRRPPTTPLSEEETQRAATTILPQDPRWASGRPPTMPPPMGLTPPSTAVPPADPRWASGRSPTTPPPTDDAPATGRAQTGAFAPTDAAPATGRAQTGAFAPTDDAPATGRAQTGAFAPTDDAPATGRAQTGAFAPTGDPPAGRAQSGVYAIPDHAPLRNRPPTVPGLGPAVRTPTVPPPLAALHAGRPTAPEPATTVTGVGEPRLPATPDPNRQSGPIPLPPPPSGPTAIPVEARAQSGPIPVEARTPSGPIPVETPAQSGPIPVEARAPAQSGPIPVEARAPAQSGPIPVASDLPGSGRFVAVDDDGAPRRSPIARALEDNDGGWRSVSDPRISSGPIRVRDLEEPSGETRVVDPPVIAAPAHAVQGSDDDARDEASIIITGTPAETAHALAAAAAAADRDQLLAAYRANRDDASLLLAVLAHLGDREPALRREMLDEAARASTGRTCAIALVELGQLAHEANDATRAMALWTRALEEDAAYEPVWLPLAKARAAAGDTTGALPLFEQVAGSPAYSDDDRAAATERAVALRGEAIVRGEIRPPRDVAMSRAQLLADANDLPGAIAAAEAAATATPDDAGALELLERLYLERGDITAASEAIGRQLNLVRTPDERALLWRRRARLYRDALGRDAEAYRCLKEAHACAPADPEVSYQLRTAAMVRGEWALAASLLYREIAASTNPRDRGALHLELAMIYEERLEDEQQAQVNYEQALAFDPTIPAAKLPLARRYEAIGRHLEAARLFEEAATTARAADRAGLLDAAAKSRAAAAANAKPDLAAQLDRAEAVGDLDAALDLAHQLWRQEPGNASAFRLLANVHRTNGDLTALTELTSVRASRAESPDERATAWLEVARLADDVGALDQAARAFDLALIEDPGHIGALDARGALAFRLGDFATADLIYRDLGPGESVLGDDELALRRSIIAEQLGRDTEALAHARAASAASPGRRDIIMRVQELATRTGDLDTALGAARSVLELVPLDDDEAQLATHFALIDLQRQAGDLEGAIHQLERILRDQPLHSVVLEQLVELYIARADWVTATRYLYQLVPLAPSPAERAERLYRLGEAVLVHLGDTDRADDVFLRASDLDPTHLPTLRRLLDVYWRADDPGALVEVATELADKGALATGPTLESSLAHALVAAALVGETQLAQRITVALGEEAPTRIAAALAELAGREGRLQLASASTAIAELARRGTLDLAKIRTAAAGTPVAGVLGTV